MAFWPWKNRHPTHTPLTTFDEVLALLEQRGGALRRAAATLLATRAELQHRVEHLALQIQDVRSRAHAARLARDAEGVRTLERDETDLRLLVRGAEEGLTHAEADAALLTQAAEEVKQRQLSLRQERFLAEAHVRAGEAAVVAQGHPGADWMLDLRLDQARDELEQARALVAVYRDARMKKA
jgi:hypothetical protein